MKQHHHNAPARDAARSGAPAMLGSCNHAAKAADLEGGWFRSGDAAVIARPHPERGESLCTLAGLSEVAMATKAEVIAFCRANIAHFKAPETVVFGPLPKTATGKIQTFILRTAAREMEPLE